MQVNQYKIGSDWYALAMISQRLLWANVSARNLVRTFPLPEGVMGYCFDVSQDRRRVIAGYYDNAGVEVWDLESGEHICRFGPSKISRMAIDATGRYVGLRSHQRRVLLDLVDRTETALPYSGELDGSCISLRNYSMYMPTVRRGLVYQLFSHTGQLESIKLPRHSVIWKMRWSPLEDQILVVESSGRVTCRKHLEDEFQWQYMFDQRVKSSLAGYSADGRFIALSVPEAGESIVLEAATGRIYQHLKFLVGDPSPYEGASITTSDGRIVDLERGTVDVGVSDWKWWRSIGA